MRSVIAAQFCFHSTLRDADKHGAVVVGVLDEDEEGLRDEVVLAQVAVSQGQEQAVLPRRLVQQACVYSVITDIYAFSILSCQSVTHSL